MNSVTPHIKLKLPSLPLLLLRVTFLQYKCSPKTGQCRESCPKPRLSTFKQKPKN
jgi:hypothetical protein